MHPILLKLGPFTVYSYGVAMVTAYLVASTLATRHARGLPRHAQALPPEHITDFCLVALLAGVVGGRVFYLATLWDYFQSRPLEWVALWQGGLVWYGGLFGGMLGVGGYARRHRLSLLPVMDQLAPVVALAHGIGRLGCFFNGCCFGVPTDAWYGVHFPGHDTPVVPTQLMEAGGLLLLSLALWRRQQRPHRPGQMTGWYLLGYALLRAGVELFRGDQPRWGGWTLPQFISVALAMAGLLLIAGRWRGRTSSR